MAKQSTNEKDFTVIGELNEDCSAILIHHFKPLQRLLKFLVGAPLEINLKKFRGIRSDRQNRYIWGVVVPTVRAWMLETQGRAPSKDGIYVWLRKSLLGDEIKVEEFLGEVILTMQGKRFSSMNTKEFADAIEIIVQEMAQKGCIIPLPKENNLLSDFLKDD